MEKDVTHLLLCQTNGKNLDAVGRGWRGVNARFVMKIEKLFWRLRDYLGKGNKVSNNDHEKLDQLLIRLEYRRDQLLRRLSLEKRTCKQKRLRIELKIVEKKLEKGKKRRNLMNKS